jgi:hypothetical protein
MNNAEVCPGLRLVLYLVLLLALASCASIGKVDPPDPTSLDQTGQVRQFKGVDADRVLLAAEAVLRRHRPDSRLVRERDVIVMEYRWQFFFVVIAGYEEERWVITARELGGMTAASVAMSYASDGYDPLTGGTSQVYPHEAGWRGAAVAVDYGMFWKQLESMLKGAEWPVCEKARYESKFRYFEPICRHKTINQFDPR